MPEGGGGHPPYINQTHKEEETEVGETMTGWTCRACANEYHDKCEQETNGVYCVCPCDMALTRLSDVPRCKECRYVLAELDSHQWCINHKCGKFEPYLSNRRASHNERRTQLR